MNSLRLALRDVYDNSWRLVPLNALLGLVLVGVAVLAISVHALLVLAVLAGPVAAALIHCAVTLVREGNLRMSDARDGLRLHWQRGLQLGAVGTVFVVVVAVALHVYAGHWALAFLALYLAVLLATYQAIVWTLAIAEPRRSLRACAREAFSVAARRPGATAALSIALLLVNAAGLAAAVMPFLTLTVAYSFVAVAHFTLEKEPN